MRIVMMNGKLHTVTVLVMLVLAGVFVLGEDLAVQTGTWEFRMTGFPMDGIPPAMRAQMEAEMSKPYKGCVTADDIKKIKFGKSDDDDQECTIVSSKLTRTGGDVVRKCEGDEPSTETLHVETPTPQTMKVTVTKKTGAKSTTLNVTGKWLSARCTE